MIPNSQDYLAENESSTNFEVQPTRTYRIDPINKRIIGLIDGRDAVLQFIKKVMSTDKYAFEIYDWNYGNELIKLIGYSYDYVVTRIPNIFREALLVDDRITGVRDFTFQKSNIDAVTVSCVIDTVYGEIQYAQEVSI